MSSTRFEKRQKGKTMREWKENFAAAMVKLRRLAVNDAGANVLEMALSSAILFSLFFGVFEVLFGIGFCLSQSGKSFI